MSYQVIIETDTDGVIVVRCPDLPGCVSQGRTVEEAMVNIQEAIAGYQESLVKHGEKVPE